MVAQELIACFADTLELCRQDSLREETARSAASGRVYREGFRSSRLFAMWDTMVEVTEEDSLDAAKKNLRYGKTAVLNFANPHFPGGGVKNGAAAQEETLCRRSNLYPCLADSRVQEEFYQYHRKETDYFFSDRLIYTRDVTVFKDGSPVPVLLDAESWFRVDVISCAAPYIAKRRYTNRAALAETFKDRICNILEAAIDNEVQVLVLGAFGCGVFRNPPEIVAGAFREVFGQARYRRAFRRVVFAIRPSTSSCPNLAAFRYEFLGIPYNAVNPSVDIVMPGGRQLHPGAEAQRYDIWRKSNPYFGKQFSVLGDSVSTLEGFNLRGRPVFYQGDNCVKTGVREMGDTWWGKVITFFGGELLVNDSWSGSGVARRPDQAEAFPSGAGTCRTEKLRIGRVMPDVVLIHMGIQDWAAGVPIQSGENSVGTFREAYGHMLTSLRESYPGAEFWCCTLAESLISSNPSFVFPSCYGGTALEEYNQVIRECANLHGCRVIDLAEFKVPYDTVDGIHPNCEGMALLASLTVRAAADEVGAAFLDCEGGHHENVEYLDETGAYRYVCKRCGSVCRRDPQPAEIVEEPVLQLYQKDTGKTLRLSGERIFAGRSKDCDLKLNSGYAARYQATFVFRNGSWYIRDNNSMNGTYLNGKKLQPGAEVALKGDDEISFAKLETVVFRPVGK